MQLISAPWELIDLWLCVPSLVNAQFGMKYSNLLPYYVFILLTLGVSTDARIDFNCPKFGVTAPVTNQCPDWKIIVGSQCRQSPSLLLPNGQHLVFYHAYRPRPKYTILPCSRWTAFGKGQTSTHFIVRFMTLGPTKVHRQLRTFWECGHWLLYGLCYNDRHTAKLPQWSDNEQIICFY